MKDLISWVRQSENKLYIGTLEGELKVEINDYIIQGVKGELYPCKPHIFQQTYEPVTDQDTKDVLNAFAQGLIGNSDDQAPGYQGHPKNLV